MSAITNTFAYLLSQARLIGTRQSAILAGVSLSVRVGGGRVQLIIARTGAPLDADEIEIFHRHCAVPAAAQRYPAVSQSRRGRRWRVAWTWQERPALELEEVDVPQPALFELPPVEEQRGDEPPV